MAQIYKILNAWLKVLDKETTKEHKKRAKICSECPNAQYRQYIDFINDELTDVKGYICTVCACPLIAKIRSTDKCPENRW